jgi:hypothetical protein
MSNEILKFFYSTLNIHLVDFILIEMRQTFAFLFLVLVIQAEVGSTGKAFLAWT